MEWKYKWIAKMKMILNSEVKVIEEIMFGDISHQFPSICYFQIRKLKKT